MQRTRSSRTPGIRKSLRIARDPHLHIGYGAGGRLVRPDLRDAHLPTRRISVEEFVRCVIVDFHAP